jgi:alpha-mannosidase
VPHLDVEIHHLETRKPLKFSKISVLDEGPLRAAVSAELDYGQSTISVVVRRLLLLGLFLR